MTKEEFDNSSENLKSDILKEIAYEYTVFVPKDEPRAIKEFKSMVRVFDKKFLDKDVLEKEQDRQIFPYNIIMGKIDKMVEGYYQEFKLGAESQRLLANYGDRGDKFKTYFTECLNNSQNTTKEAVKKELFKQLCRGNDAKCAIEGVGKVIERRTVSVGKLIESLTGQMDELMVLWDYQDKGYTRYRIKAVDETCDACRNLDGKVFKIRDRVIGEKFPRIHPHCDCIIEILDGQENLVYTIVKPKQKESEFGKYLRSSLKQLILGNYTDDVTLLGTIMQVLTGLIGTDLPADIRDLSYDITHFKPTKQHIFQTVLDTVALVPIVGAVKYIDEAGDIAKAGVKHGDEIVDVVKAVDKATNFKDFPKKIHHGRQGKHIVGHNNYKKQVLNGKTPSILTITTDFAEKLVKQHSGTGQKISNTSERIDFKTIIGKFVDQETGKAYDTTIGTIRYSKDGVHIVPARPKN